MMEILSSVLWNVFLFTFLVIFFSLPSPLVWLQTYLTTNTIYIIEAAEPLSLLFLFFLIVGTTTFALNYYFQLYLNKSWTTKSNKTKKLFSTPFIWSQLHLTVIKLPNLLGKQLK